MDQVTARLEAAERLQQLRISRALSARQHSELLDDISLAVDYMGGNSDGFEMIIAAVLDQHGHITAEGEDLIQGLGCTLTMQSPQAAYVFARLLLSMPGVDWKCP
ncbi:hypothetical protein [Pseudomonas nitroreducens]|uniref:Uncharacterized protein n=1 Tax=Pseudomonas nitroreducens TaxID=46680 RepID=A0A2D0ADY5_PSENT|nr:hypothetical protein [Pseudomonas nitroreducens]OWP50284.1 hypothetical protein CEG18_12080 [Pseudomonas nitroreducens]